jgi:diphosphomevalonate decarboxylase
MLSSAASHPNKAIVIYWGNDNDELNIPSRTSLSMTLEGINRELTYTVTLKTSSDLDRDKVIIDGREDKGEIHQDVARHLDAMRERAKFKDKLIVATRSTFPIGSGLAGSAAASSAIAEAFGGLVGNHDKKQISLMARRGSGSAARSVFGGFVKLEKGPDDQSFAVQLWDEKHWDIRDAIAVVDPGPKKIRSRDGMRMSTQTCPRNIYSEFVDIAQTHVSNASDAIALRDLHKLGAVYEADNMLFRRVCMNTRPALDYWSAATERVFSAVADLQSEGLPVFAGTDAGPNVHILTNTKNVEKVINKIEQIHEIKEVIHAMPGAGSHLTNNHVL